MLEPKGLSCLSRILLPVFLFIGASHAQSATPSFDCAKAGSLIETVICGDDPLAALDVRLAAELRAAIKRVPGERETVLADQRGWLEKRNKKCISNSPDPRSSKSEITECLTDQYEERIAQLKSTPSICEESVRRFRRIREMAQNSPSSSEDEINWIKFLGISVSQPLTAFEYSPEEWTKQMKHLLHVSKIDKELSEEIGEGRVIISALSPAEGLYLIETSQGLHSCYHGTYMRVVNGTARLADDVSVDDAGEDGGYCYKARRLGTIKGRSAMIDVEVIPPSVKETISLRLRTAGAWTPLCAIDLNFEPEFSTDNSRSPTAGGKCKGSVCLNRRSAALDIVKLAQTNPDRVEPEALSRLPPDRRVDYEHMKHLLEPSSDDVGCEAEPDRLFAPLINDGQVLAVKVTHTALGCYGIVDRTWSVEINQLRGDALDLVDSFEVQVTEGQLISIKAHWADED
jgi:uncharacterized protein